MTETTWLIAGAIWIICGLGAYLIAVQKGDPSAGVWALAGVLLGPIGLVLTVFMAKPATVTAPSVERDSSTAVMVMVLLIVGAIIAAAAVVLWFVVSL